MEVFESWQSYSKFERAVKHHSRYIHSPDIKAFLEIVLKTAENRIEILPKNIFFWRAQLGHDLIEQDEEVGKVPAPYPPERMQPRPDQSMEGRANPKGIPYLYLASERDTALAEVRPWIGSYVSICQFKTLKELRVVNCTMRSKGDKIYPKEPSPKKREEAVWADIDREFARPVFPSDDVADYVPTQVIAELFKANGFDGIAYRSSLGKGHNIAIYDIQAAKPINCFLFELRGIDFDFVEIPKPYYLNKHYKKSK